MKQQAQIERRNTKSTEMDEYIIVTTSYPTTKNVITTSAEEVALQSEHFVSDESYPCYEDAVEAARLIRNSDEKFYRPDGVDETDDPDEFWGEEPPWDSADVTDWKFRTATRLEVMTRAEYREKCSEEKQNIHEERRRSMLSRRIRRSLLAAQVAAAGCVHYSTPPQPYDIPAEVEIDEDEALRNMVPGTEEVAVPNNASTIKSLKFSGLERWKANMEAALILPCSSESDNMGSSFDLLLHVLQRCTALEELYLEMKIFVGSELPSAYIEQILRIAPHLVTSLKVLSISQMFVGPDCLYSLGKFKRLERLDLSDTFYTEQINLGMSRSFDELEDALFPYDIPLLNCIESLPNLVRVDIGHGKEHMKNYFFDVAMSEKGMIDVKELMEEKTNGEGQVTMDVERMPMKWKSVKQEEAETFKALWGMIENEDEDNQVREVAMDTVQRCPCCFQNGTQYCSRCMKQWYCSRKCQVLHWEKHKMVCNNARKQHKMVCKKAGKQHKMVCNKAA
mmetsp:Transcript_18928/g.26049  ORF Transcript_18928/g.26049 Transcript_18928/m.26049 type:complete len:507 (-) Transcript_18928:218-1738(-)